MNITYQNIPSGHLAVVRLSKEALAKLPDESFHRLTSGQSIHADVAWNPAGELVLSDAPRGRFDQVVDWNEVGYSALIDVEIIVAAKQKRLSGVDLPYINTKDVPVIRVTPGRWRWVASEGETLGLWIGDAFPMEWPESASTNDPWNDRPKSGSSKTVYRESGLAAIARHVSKKASRQVTPVRHQTREEAMMWAESLGGQYNDGDDIVDEPDIVYDPKTRSWVRRSDRGRLFRELYR